MISAIKRAFAYIPVIAPESSKAADLLVAVPVSSVAGGAAIALVMGIANPVQVVIQLPLLPFMAAFLALFVFPFALLLCVPVYFLLRRYDQLRFRTSLTVGGGFGFVVPTLGSLVSNGGLGAIVLLTITGLATAAGFYQTLALLAKRRSPNESLQATPQSGAAEF